MTIRIRKRQTDFEKESASRCYVMCNKMLVMYEKKTETKREAWTDHKQVVIQTIRKTKCRMNVQNNRIPV